MFVMKSMELWSCISIRKESLMCFLKQKEANVSKELELMWFSFCGIKDKVQSDTWQGYGLMEVHSVVNLLYQPLFLCKISTKECRKFYNSNLHLICTPNVHVTIPMPPCTSKFKLQKLSRRSRAILPKCNLGKMTT